MPHIQLEIDFLTHPKTLATSPLAQLLFIRSLIYAATHLTDGFIPEAALPQLAYDLTQYERLHYVPANIHAAAPDVVTVEEIKKELVFHKRWKVCRGGFRIHDYLDYQLSRAQVLQLIDKRRKAGQAGGQASAQARAQANGKQTVNDFPTIFNPIPIPIPIPMSIPKEGEKKDCIVVDKPRPKANRGCIFPDGFEPDERGVSLATSYGLNPHKELAAFRDHHTAKGSVFKDWQAAYRNWLRNSLRFTQRSQHAVSRL